MKFASLFTGIGGFDIAAEWMGWDVLFQCEFNPFCQRVLKYYWPNTKLYGDIKTTDFTIWRDKIDILVGGPPCQPASVAGRRKGTTDDRWLWLEAFRAVREIKPRYIVFENPIGIVSLEDGKQFEWILSTLENEGYTTEVYNISACGIQAPHERQRIWFVAYSNSIGQRWKQQEINKRKKCVKEGTKMGSFNKSNGTEQSSSNPNELNGDLSGFRTGEASQQPTPEIFGNITDSDSKRQSGPNYWQNFPTQSPICDRNDGISDRLVNITFPKWRNESIKTLGNAVVPQIPYEIFKTIKIIENEYRRT